MKRLIQTSVMLIPALLFLVSCGGGEAKKADVKDSVKAKKAEVYYFHGDRKCRTCEAVGNISKSTVADHFGKNQEVGFNDVNIDKEENQTLANKFQVSGSGLYLQTQEKGKEYIYDMTAFAFMYALNNPDTLKNTLITKINTALK